MTRLYVHIGLGKTGTTAIQKYLADERESLMRDGLHYIRAGDAGGQGHQAVAKHFIDVLPDYMTAPPDGIEEVLSNLASEIESSPAHTFLISSENFPMANVARVSHYFRSLPGNPSIKIIVFVRSQDELAESEYNQMVKLKGERRTFEQYVRDQSDAYDFLRLLKPWSDAFGDDAIIARVFNARLRQVITQFLGCISEISADAVGEDGSRYRRENMSVGMKGVVLCRLLNELPEPVQPGNMHALTAAIPGDVPAVLMDSQTAALMRSRYHDSNREFSRRFLGREMWELEGCRYLAEERDELRQKAIAAVMGSSGGSCQR